MGSWKVSEGYSERLIGVLGGVLSGAPRRSEGLIGDSEGLIGVLGGTLRGTWRISIG